MDDILRELRASGQCVRHFQPNEIAKIDQFRDLGRRAGRQLGWKVRTAQSDPPHPPDGAVVVFIVVTQSTTLHQELMRIRGEKALRRAFDRPHGI
jgi:hypothetical protein